MKHILFLDFDGVLTPIDSSWMHIHRKLGTTKGATKNRVRFKSGEISFEEWGILDVALWKGVTRTRFIQAISDIPLRSDTAVTLERLKLMDFELAIISAAPHQLVLKHADNLGVHFVRAVEILIEGGRVLGQVKMLVTDENKGAHVQSILDQTGVHPDECVAIGDTVHDLRMLEAVGFGIAFNSKSPVLRDTASLVVDDECLSAIIKPIQEWLDNR